MADSKTILLLNGPNLNLLGKRNPDVYGSQTLEQIEDMVRAHAAEKNWACICRQSNHEGELIDIIHEADNTCAGIVYNPGAHAHYSYAIRDAIEAISIPVVEVHISDIHAREDFRATSVVEDVCVASICGKGTQGG
jgi:3-dehydroquinate dehydratase-2